MCGWNINSSTHNDFYSSWSFGFASITQLSPCSSKMAVLQLSMEADLNSLLVKQFKDIAVAC